MTRRYRVVHRTEYKYSAEVTRSYGHAHLVPRNEPGQHRLSSALTSDPVAAELHEHEDFFGNTSAYFAVFEPHTRLTVTSTSEVEIRRTTPSAADLDTVGWADARMQLAADVDARGFLIGSPLVRLSETVADYAAGAFRPGLGLGAAVQELTTRIYQDFRYLPGATSVRTTLGEILKSRKGVCQDFAHLAVGCLRSVGLPARYVSGYLETQPPPGQPRLQGADASHAWAEVLVPGVGWVGLDPTNDQFVGASYVITAWGRDYSDVPPLTGVIITDAKSSSMRVSVDVARIDDPAVDDPAVDAAGGARL
jgi:transglutaminase-like putative cysteine protease